MASLYVANINSAQYWTKTIIVVQCMIFSYVFASRRVIESAKFSFLSCFWFFFSTKINRQRTFGVESRVFSLRITIESMPYIHSFVQKHFTNKNLVAINFYSVSRVFHKVSLNNLSNKLTFCFDAFDWIKIESGYSSKFWKCIVYPLLNNLKCTLDSRAPKHRNGFSATLHALFIDKAVYH